MRERRSNPRTEALRAACIPAGVVDQDGDVAQLLLDVEHEGLDLVVVTYVAAPNVHARRTLRLQLLGRVIKRLPAPATYRHLPQQTSEPPTVGYFIDLLIDFWF